MRMVAGFAGTGAVLGAIVAVAAHFMSHTLPTHYTVGVYQIGNRVNFGSTPPSVHPSWWPPLFIAVVAGVVIGVGLGLVAHRVGLRFSRPAAPQN